MTKELENQIEALSEHYCSEFMDAYQCMDWGITAQEFATHLINYFSEEVQQYAAELDSKEDN